MMCAASRQAGFSLVELMVAVVISSFAIIAIYHALGATEGYKRSTVSANDAQTNGAFAMAVLEREVKSAGYGFVSDSAYGCDPLRYQVGASLAPGGGLPALRALPIRIEMGPGPDAIVVAAGGSNVRSLPSAVQSSMAGADAPVVLADPAGFLPGDVVLFAQGAQCSLMQVSGVATNQMLHAAGPATRLNPAAGTSQLPLLSQGARAFNLGTPAFRRFAVGPQGLEVSDLLQSALGTPSSSMIAGDIVDLRAQYGKENGTPGQLAQFDRIEPATPQEWARVTALRIALLVRSQQFEKPAPGQPCSATVVAPSWSGGPFDVPGGLPNCYKFRVYENVLPLRNAIWRVQA